jgi:hypothetical protein
MRLGADVWVSLAMIGLVGCQRSAATTSRETSPAALTAESSARAQTDPKPAPAVVSSAALAKTATTAAASAGRALATPSSVAPGSLAVSEAPSAGCVRGFTRPEPGSELRRAALDMLRRKASEHFVVTEIRYFIGPEDAQVIEPRRDVERWYVKAYSDSDPKFRHRWLLRRVPQGQGVDAIAPYDSVGYAPKTWHTVDDPLIDDPFENPCFGNKAPAGAQCSGLPAQVMGCLEGT